MVAKSGQEMAPEETQGMLIINFSEGDVTWLSSEISFTEGFLRVEEIYVRHWYICFEYES